MDLRITKKIIAVILLLAIGFSLFSAAFLILNNKGSHLGKTESLTIGIPWLEQNALIYIAANQSLFINNGLNVTIKGYDSGLTSINALLNDEVTIAESAEFPFVNAVCNNKRVSIIAVNDKFENDYIVGLKSRGIETVSDLKGKTVGVAKGTIAEFYLGRFLDLNGLSLEEVNVVNVSPGDYVKAIADGTVDAIVAWQPYINQMQEEVSGIVTWQVQNGQDAYGVLVCNNGWLTQHPEIVEHFLKALKEAEDYTLHHPDLAKMIIKNGLNYSDSYTADIWSKNSYLLSLDQSLVTAMKDEAQWMILYKLTNQTNVPNFADFIYPDVLKSISPNSVTIIK